jgi:hypothetical protein
MSDEGLGKSSVGRRIRNSVAESKRIGIAEETASESMLSKEPYADNSAIRKSVA